MVKLANSVQITLIIVIAIAGLILIAAYPDPNTINVNGQSSIDATPDIITISFNIETTGNTSKEASDANYNIFNQLTQYIVLEGFDREDIKTTHFNIYEDYYYEDYKGDSEKFTATHSVKVEISPDEIGKVIRIIDAGVKAGAGITNINFELSQELQSQYKAQALGLAAQDARAKAQSIADGFGMELGDLVSTNTDNYHYRPWMVYESAGMGMATDVAMAKEAVTNIQPSDRKITASISAVFELI